MGTKTIIAIMFCTALMGMPQALSAQRVVHDDQKFKQWRSMENGPCTGGKTMCRWEGVSWGWVIGLEVRELGAGLWRAVEKRNVLQV